MTSEEFLQAILAEPEDDFPRLIYADWLEERGDLRGEFIRLQCEMARLKNPESRWRGRHERLGMIELRSQPALESLLDRQTSLLLAHRKEWLEPFSNGLAGAVFERGFVEEGYVTGKAYLHFAPEWYRQTPLRKLHLEVQDSLNAILQSPFLLHVISLEFFPPNFFTDLDAALLAESPNLANLRHLDVGTSHSITARGLRALLDSQFLKNLKSLVGLEHVQ